MRPTQEPRPAPDLARALEAQMRALRASMSAGLVDEAYERWGNPSRAELEEMDRIRREARENRERIQGEIEAEVARLREEAPEVVRAWAEAHLFLLDRFLAALDPGDKHDVHRYVAKKEKGEWQEVADGGRAFVDQNVFYVRYDPELYEQVFGKSDK